LSKLIPLKGQPNFRDLGGMRTVDGQVIKSGLVFRSGELCDLSDCDITKLENIGVRTVIDFRSNREMQFAKPDRLPTQTNYQRIPIDFGDLTKVIWEGFDDGDFSRISKNLLTDLNTHNFLYSNEQYSALLNTLINNQNLPLVFHCSHGKDRVGIGTAILLSALGVPRSEVIKDYLASNIYRAEANRELLQNIRRNQAEKHGIPPAQVNVSALEAIYFLKASYLEDALDVLISKFQSFDSYLNEALGLGGAEIAELKTNLLQPAN